LQRRLIDRIIPLGLVLVEALIAALGLSAATDVKVALRKLDVKVALRKLDEEQLELCVTSDGDRLNHSSEKVMAGLAGQLKAKRQYRDDVFVLTFPP
jgi:hypothetical protein